jgi:hypothetical protein
MSDTTNDPKAFLAELQQIDAEYNGALNQKLKALKEKVWDEEVAIEETTGGVRTIIKQGAKAVEGLASLLR